MSIHGTPSSDADNLSGGSESLEDALSRLEASDNGNWASDGVDVPFVDYKLPDDDEVQQPQKSKKKKGSSKSKIQGERAAQAEEDEEEKTKAILDEYLEKMAEPAGKKAKKKSKKSSSKSDDQDPQAMLKEAMEKMFGGKEADGAKPDDEGTNLQERLEALIAADEEKDKDPDIRKAKDIIKNAMKKMNSGKESKKGGASKQEQEGDEGHMEFAKRLQAEAAKDPEHELQTVRSEFKKEFGNDAKRLLCSGCKLVAARLTSELSNHDVHESETPAEMIANKRKAIDSACLSFRHLHVVNDESGARFEASQADDSGSEVVRLGQKLCIALLEDAKFELLSNMIRSKVPEASMFHPGAPPTKNYERLICAQKARVCKRNEVREDDDEEL